MTMFFRDAYTDKPTTWRGELEERIREFKCTTGSIPATGLRELCRGGSGAACARSRWRERPMTDVALDDTALQRWRSDPTQLHRGGAARSRDRQAVRAAGCRACVHAARLRARCQWSLAVTPSRCTARPKKSGKTTLAALIVLVMVLLRSDGRFAEGYCVANDFEQAQSRVFTVIRRIVEVSPLLKREARITADRISSRRSTPASWRSRPTRRRRLAATRRSVASTNCGATPASARGGCGTR